LTEKLVAQAGRTLSVPRIAGVICLVLAAIAGFAAFRRWPDTIWHSAQEAAGYAASLGAIGWVIALGGQFLIALCGIVPASVGAFSMGMAYGLIDGFLISAAATILGAVVAFLLARGALRPQILRLTSRRPAMQRLDEAVGRDGWRLVALMRLSPVMPFAMTSYAFGLTSLSLRAYLAGTLASLPALFGYVAIGHLGKEGYAAAVRGEASVVHWCLLGVASFGTVLLTLHLGRIVTSALRLPAPR
jgi:uncharacterized membrane protein YdjX (TVP38/TMEM64 family)